MSRSDLVKIVGLAAGTMAKLSIDEDVAPDVRKRICAVCNCNIGGMVDVLID